MLNEFGMYILAKIQTPLSKFRYEKLRSLREIIITDRIIYLKKFSTAMIS
jgi:hypothetical protein